MPEKDAWDLGGGGESFQFNRVGDEVEGYITDMDSRQGSDMQTNEPAWWDKEQTRPVMLTLVTLQTTLREGPKDTGLRTITLAGSKKPNPDGTKSRMCAARTAVLEATGTTAFEPGAWFKMRFSSEGARTKPGFNPPKYFEAWYRSPVHDLDGQDRTAPVNQVLPSSQPGANWPAPSGPAPEWSNATGTTTTNPGTVSVTTAQSNTAPTTGPLTLAQVQAMEALNIDPASVFGADYKTRIVG